MSYDPNQPPYRQPPYGQPPSGQPPYQQPPPPYPRPPYGQPQAQYPLPSYVPPPYRQPPQRSRRRLWIMLGIAGALLVLLGGGLVLGVNLWNRAERAATATQFYTAIEHQDYVAASGFLQVAGGSAIAAREQQLFVTSAKLLDKTKGPVTNFQITADAHDASTVVVTVTRHGPPYPVHLQIQQVEGIWKIIKSDGL